MVSTVLQTCASVSIGCPFVSGGFVPLVEKIKAFANAGFGGIELAHWDLIPFAEQILQRKVTETDWDSLVEAATQASLLCKSYGLKIVVAVALFQAEGWPRDSPQRKQVMEKVRHWSRIMRAMGTDTLLIAASDAGTIHASIDDIAADLAEIADVLCKAGQRVAYENLCWATVAPTWATGWDIVKKANRTNLGLCLDTFHIAAYEWGDPTSQSGKREESSAMSAFLASLDRLTLNVPSDKIFLFQVGDAYKLAAPVDPRTTSLRPRQYWASVFRPMPLTGGGFLPVEQVVQAVMKTGYDGPVSIEIFDGGRDGNSPSTQTPQRQAELLKEVLEKVLIMTRA